MADNPARRPLHTQVPKRPCHHIMTPIPVGDRVIHATSLIDMGVNKHRKDGRGLGIYLDSAWGSVYRSTLLTSPKVWIPWDEPWEVVFVKWPDMNVIPVVLLDRLVKFILRQPKKKVIEVGCLGGHGRTGTLLSALVMLAEGRWPIESIKEVRKRYCEKAVETASQVGLLQGLGRRNKP